MKPHENNACSGKYKDWVEVYLTNSCNGHCKWCVAKEGFHPSESASVEELTLKINSMEETHFIFLGGEPTLYPDLEKLINSIKGKHLYITSNGNITKKFEQFYHKFDGINISIHSWDLLKNEEITGIKLEAKALKEFCNTYQKVRFNCTCFRPYMQSYTNLVAYTEFAKDMGASSIRFAELKGDSTEFVNLATILGKAKDYNPFTCGCSYKTNINGMVCDIRFMCGLNTDMRECPIFPNFIATCKKVLYYDGNIYDGWVGKTKGKLQEELFKIQKELKIKESIIKKLEEVTV